MRSQSTLSNRFTLFFIFSVMIFLVAHETYAAGFITRTSGTTSTIYDVQYLNATDGVAVGSSGTILVTTNGGSTWVSKPAPGVTATLYGVDFYATDTAVVVGDGVVLRTTSGGNSWDVATTPGIINRAVDFAGGTTGYRVGNNASGTGIIYRSTDGGLTWSSQSIPAGTPTLWDVQCSFFPLTCYASGSSGTILKTSTSTSWIAQTSGTTYYLYSLTAVSPTTVWAVGAGGTVRKTTNGSTWTNPISGVAPTTQTLRSVDFISSTEGWAVGAGGTVLHTINGGSTWTVVDVGMPTAFFYGTSFLIGANASGLVGGSSGRLLQYDQTPPEIPSGLARTTPSNDATPSFGWNSVSDNSNIAPTYEYSIDDGAWVSTGSITSATVASPLTHGNHDIAVRARDSVNNISGVSTPLSFTIDTTAPNTTVTSGPASETTSTDATFIFTGTETATFACALDGGSFSACTSPAAFSGFSVGAHTFQVRATDSAGNTDATPASYSWTVTAPSPTTDATPPETTITSNPSASTASTSASFSFTANESGTFSCALDTGSFISCISPMNYSGLAMGTHTFQVRATDSAGNTDATPASYSWTITAPPPSGDTMSPTAPTGLIRTTGDTNQNPTFTWNVSTDNVGVTSYEYQLDSDTFVNIGNVLSVTLSTVSAGSHTFSVRARDAAGNVSVVSFLSFTITSSVPSPSPDTTSPSIPTGLIRTSTDTDTTPTFTWNQSSDNVAVTAYHIQLDGGVFIGLGNATAYTAGELSQGNHTIGVRAGDAAGNVSGVSTISFVITSNSGGGESLPLPAGVNYSDLVKLPNDGDPNTYADTAVFYVGTNGKRYVFPNDKTYFTWYSDFSMVKTITPGALASLPLAGNVTYRPGVKMVKLQTNPDVYVVGRGGVLHKVPSEEVASSLYGMDWNKKIDDVSDAFWFNYRVDTPLVSALDFSPSSETAGTLTISADKAL